MARHKNTILFLAIIAVMLTGCGHSVARSSPVKGAARPSHASAIALGRASLAIGSVWQLNSPGDGTPHESLTIQDVHGHAVTATVYLTGFGTLLNATLKGRVEQDRRLALRGHFLEQSLGGGTESLPIDLDAIAHSRHTLWVTQTIKGDATDTFVQLSFREGH